ncbi:MAG: RsmB/NOP family class I SAM-dependent RNA methyltransferase [Filifactoraceae bacterium]
MKNLPVKFLELMKTLLNAEYESFIKTYGQDRNSGLRATQRKISREKLRNILDFDTDEVPWCNQGLYFREEEKPGKLPYYHAGLYYIQEPSAMAPVEYLDVKEGMKVLDLCSAPGGKSIQIANKLNGTGILVTNDISEKRIKAVLKNIELYGIENAVVVNDSPERLYEFFGEYFDRILLDVPCSGEGMFRKDDGLISSYDDALKQVPNLQREILRYGGRMLKPGGVLIYSTCTFNKEENEDKIKEFLDNNEDFYLENIPKEFGFEEGVEVNEAARLYPHKLNGEGHFLCKLIKKGSLQVESKDNLYKEPPKIYRDFEKENLNINLNGNFVLQGDKLYLETEDFKNKKGLRLVRNGLYLGDIKNNKFLPSQAFIMNLSFNDVKFALNLNVNDIRVNKYLKGETIFDDINREGIIFIAINGYLLGYGKISKGTIKNFYNKSWRMS